MTRKLVAVFKSKKHWAILTFLLLFMCFASCGCLTIPATNGLPLPLPEELTSLVSYEQQEIHNSSEVIGETNDYVINRARFDSSTNVLGREHEIVIDYYQLKGKINCPVIFLLPTLGGNNEIANKFARHFASNGYACLIVHRQEEYTDIWDFTELNPTFRQIVIDHRQVIDWVGTKPELDQNRIGVFGVSMGAIKATLVAASDDRIKVAVLGLGGADIPSILANSKENGIVKRREEIMARDNLSVAEFETLVRSQFDFDPSVFSAALTPQKTLQVVALFDNVVPTGNQLDLRRSIHYPRTIFIPTGHYSAILFLPLIKGKSLAFFDEQL